MSERFEQEGGALSEEAQTKIRSLVDTYIGPDSYAPSESGEVATKIFTEYREKNPELPEDKLRAMCNGIRRYVELRLQRPDIQS